MNRIATEGLWFCKKQRESVQILR